MVRESYGEYRVVRGIEWGAFYFGKFVSVKFDLAGRFVRVAILDGLDVYFFVCALKSLV